MQVGERGEMPLQIKRVDVAVAQSIRPTDSVAHPCDGVWDVCHLGAFIDKVLVGSVSAYALGPGPVPAMNRWLVHGPFGSEGAGLMAALVATAPANTRVWAPNQRRLLVAADGIYAATSTAESVPPAPKSEGGYSANGIVVAPNMMAAVRNRPEMYIGTGDDRAVRALIGGVIAASVEGYRDATVRRIEVEMTGDGVISVCDDGPGAPVLESTVAVASMMVQRATRWPSAHHRPFIGGHVAVATALSDFAEVETGWKGRRYKQVWRQAVPLMHATDMGGVEHEYFRFRFRPDYGALRAPIPTLSEVKTVVEELVWLNPGLVMAFNGEALVAPKGVVDAACVLSGSEAGQPGFHKAATDGYEIRVAAAVGGSDDIRLFVNQSPMAFPAAVQREVADALIQLTGGLSCVLVVDVLATDARVSRDGATVLVGPSALLDAVVASVQRALESAQS